jgi:hypothetical protein
MIPVAAGVRILRTASKPEIKCPQLRILGLLATGYPVPPGAMETVFRTAYTRKLKTY